MKANNTGETNIKVVEKYFWLKFVFNALKTSLNLYLSLFIALSLFLIFEIRGVLSFKTCLEGGNLVKLTMHALWCIMGCSSNIFHQRHMHRTIMGGQQGLVLQENHGGMWVKGVDERVWAVQPMEHAVTIVTKQRWVYWRKIKPGAWRPPRPVGPGRPSSPLFKHPGAPVRQVSLPASSLFVRSSL
jgi:hypothetical protein